MLKFYDTCALLNLQEGLIKTNEHFIISYISLIELEEIKTSKTKDENIKWSVRQLLHLLDNYKNYTVLPYKKIFDDDIQKNNLLLNNDSRIIISAYHYQRYTNNEIVFITDDLSCKTIAEAIGLKTLKSNKNNVKTYSGFFEIEMNDEELSNFYSNIIYNNLNPYNLKINEYILIKKDKKIIDKYKYTNGGYEKIKFNKTESKMFGKITPKDDFQLIALDSLKNNQLTMLRGPAGSGKSYLAFGYMFELLETGKIDKIIVFCNTVATKGSAKLGFYPGSRTEKLLDSQIGNLLESKLGDRIAVERLIDDGQLVLLPMSDIRGYDTTGMNAAIYISEAQNLDIELMRLALQRIGDDSICILDGDYTHQVDMSLYAGSNNGMRRVSEIYKGQDFYGEIELQKIYRSKIAKIAEQL